MALGIQRHNTHRRVVDSELQRLFRALAINHLILQRGILVGYLPVLPPDGSVGATHDGKQNCVDETEGNHKSEYQLLRVMLDFRHQGCDIGVHLEHALHGIILEDRQITFHHGSFLDRVRGLDRAMFNQFTGRASVTRSSEVPGVVSLVLPDFGSVIGIDGTPVDVIDLHLDNRKARRCGLNDSVHLVRFRALAQLLSIEH